MGKHDAKQPKLNFDHKRSTRQGELVQGPQATEERDLTADDQGEDLHTLMLEMRSSLRNIDTKLDNLASQLDYSHRIADDPVSGTARIPLSLARWRARRAPQLVETTPCCQGPPDNLEGHPGDWCPVKPAVTRSPVRRAATWCGLGPGCWPAVAAALGLGSIRVAVAPEQEARAPGRRAPTAVAGLWPARDSEEMRWRCPG
ncbi:hypothetical protein NDU88_004006 [Pleurodeles waltl]|uniref:Uncharacterized protein n=1 Tax=Pleurodeles waltl TaxID=8319 RepID=A0AAV7M8M6_PLEWA|nr:hypothetical protein NDU88_004006 [Pleurodeles waltl]